MSTRQTIARVAMLAGLFAMLPAQALTVAFSGSGVVNGPAQTLPFFSGLVITPADASYTQGGQPGWAIDVVFGGALTPEGGYAGTMNGSFARGADSLVFTGTQGTVQLGQPITLSYTITSGTGLYAGLVGRPVQRQFFRDPGARQSPLFGTPVWSRPLCSLGGRRY